jgi:hypothetical protein
VSRAHVALLFGLAAPLAGCPAPQTDPPPPPRKAEIAVAPPRALGALAAGTDAAPKPDASPVLGDDDGSLAPPGLPAPAPPATTPDAGAAPPAPTPATPDAGMAL